MRWFFERNRRLAPALAGCGLALLGLAPDALAAGPAADAALANEADGRDWAGHGRTFSEAHFSPLALVNRESVPRLNLAWTLDLSVTDSLTTPLAVQGVIYVAAGNSIVHAVDGKTGKLLWRHDPQVRSSAGTGPVADAGTRGLAFSRGRLFVSTQDGRLIAIDAKAGQPVWSIQALESSDGQFLSGTPRVFRNTIVIGAGSTAGRGSVTAYDADTGKQLWRRDLGTAPAAITFDPEFNRLYVSTAGASAPPARAGEIAGAEAPYANSVVALDADRGEYAWHYPTSPADITGPGPGTDLTLAMLAIDGAPRQVILHTPGNGLFQVLDRATGKPVSAAKSAGAQGSWPQSFSPRTGFAYLSAFEPPAIESAADAGRGFLTAWDPVKRRAVWQQPTPGRFNGGTLVTAGDLVFQGQADGYINAYGAADGRRVWSFYAASAALGTPITFAIGKQQYVALLTGPQSAPPELAAMSAKFGWDARIHPHRLLTFVLDGKAKLPPTPLPTFAKPLEAPAAAQPAAPAEQPEPLKAPGSLESTGVPPGS